MTRTPTGRGADRAEGAAVRPPRAEDREALLATLRAAELLPPDGVAEVAADLDAFLGGVPGVGRWWVAAVGPDVAGVAYAVLERMTDRTWNLLMLAVHPDRQRSGVGSALVHGVEADLRAASARLLIVDTSGLASFRDQRRFYTGLGFTEQARIPDFFEAGDDKVVFTRPLA